MSKNGYLLIEFMLIFFGLPILIWVDKDFIHPAILLLPCLVFILLILKYRTEFKFIELKYLRISKKEWIKNSVIILLAAALLLAGTVVFERENLFNLIRANPFIFIAIVVFYPIFSAYAQEIIFRTFLFWRYRTLFRNNFLFILASSASFSFMHIVYYNPVSMILTFAMGIYLAQVYLRTRSVLFTTILHGILGILVFAFGLGQYFWLDMPLDK